MSFVSDRQRRWYFASGGGLGSVPSFSNRNIDNMSKDEINAEIDRLLNDSSNSGDTFKGSWVEKIKPMSEDERYRNDL